MRRILPVLALLVCCAAARAADRPNVLLILTDDQGWGDIHSHGNDKLDTPVLDRLAAEGARFDRFYVSPLCAPTRSALLTGRYHLRTGVAGVTRSLETMRKDEVTIAQAFKAAGYATGCFGKWHNGAYYPHHPLGKGFDEFFGFCGGHWNHYFDTPLEHNGAWVPTKGYITDVLADRAMAFMEASRNKPFFCYVPFNAPHSPFQVPDRYFEKYKARGFDDRNACVYGMVENIDDNVGRMLRKLEELKLAGNTIVLFLTDNGPNTPDRYNGVMRGAKGAIYDGGVRVPLFVRWPGKIKPGTTVRPVAAHVDLFPTLAEFCGVPLPAGVKLDGSSLVPLLTGSGAPWPQRMLLVHQSRGENWATAPGAVRTDTHCAVVSAKGVELYDQQADPAQKTDIAAQHPALVAKLKSAYQAWFKDVTTPTIERQPIPVGYEAAPVVEMVAPDCYMDGGLKYKGRTGWAHDWIANWTSTDGRAWWDLEVVRGGTYEVTLLYTCPPGSEGAQVRVNVGEAAVVGTVARAHDPAIQPAPNRVPAHETGVKEWGQLCLGTLPIPAGRRTLEVRALSKPGEIALELKAVRLKRVP